MRPCAYLSAAILLLACASPPGAAAGDPADFVPWAPPAQEAPPPPAPAGDTAEGDATPPPAPAPEAAPPGPPPAAPAPEEEPPAPPAAPAPAVKTSAEAQEVIGKAADAQGTRALRGKDAVTRFRVGFTDVKVFGKDEAMGTTTESLAPPPPGMTEARYLSVSEFGGERQRLGHAGRFGWLWTAKGGVRTFTDPVRDRQDLQELDDRRRMLRMALRVFFLGNLAEGPAVALDPDEEIEIPFANGEKPRKVSCHRLDRAADPAAGEPALRLFLDAKTLRPVAALIPGTRPGESSFLLTLDDFPIGRKPEAVPAGIVVPTWVELFEIPAKEGASPEKRIVAAVASLVIDPAQIPDGDFLPPR